MVAAAAQLGAHGFDGLVRLAPRVIDAAQLCTTVPSGARQSVQAFPTDELERYRGMRDVVSLQMRVADELERRISDGDYAQGAAAAAGAAGGAAGGGGGGVSALEAEAARKVDEIHSRVMEDLTPLYDVCKRFGLHEYCLRVISCSRIAAAELEQHVDSLWRSIIAAAGPGPNGFTLLRRTVRRLGDEFLSNDVIFPVARLCRMLERHAAQGGEEPEWAVETLLAVGGDAQRAELFRQAYGAVTAMVNEALAPSAQLRLLESVRGLLERWERFDERLFRQQVRARCCMYTLLRHISLSLFLHRPCHSHSPCLSS